MLISDEYWSRRRFPVVWLLLLLGIHLVALRSLRDESVPIWPLGVGLSASSFAGFIMFRSCSFEGEAPSMRRGIGAWTGVTVAFSCFLILTGCDEWLLPSVLLGAIASSDIIRQAWRSRGVARPRACADGSARSVRPGGAGPTRAAITETGRDCPCELQGLIDEFRINPVGLHLWICDECEAAWTSSEAVDEAPPAGSTEEVIKRLAPDARRVDVEIVGQEHR